MSKRFVPVVIVLLTLAMGLAGCGASAPKVDWNLAVSGAVTNPLTLSYSDLAKMPQTELKDVLMEKSTGEDTVGSWSGVPLQEILTKAGASTELASITALAADGYAIEIAKDELADGIVALKQDGKWITEADPDHGPIRLVLPHTPANRWAFQLTELQVNETAQGGGAIPENAALKITGAVDSGIGWTEEKLRSMDTIQAQYTNKQGETQTYTGVALNDLLGKAKPKAEAKTLVFVGGDGYTAEVPLADVQGCTDCIIAFRDQGGFSTVLPGFPGNVQVKGITEIQVK